MFELNQGDQSWKGIVISMRDSNHLCTVTGTNRQSVGFADAVQEVDSFFGKVHVSMHHFVVPSLTSA